MHLISAGKNVAIYESHIVEVNIHRTDKKSIVCTCANMHTNVYLAEYDSEEKARVAFGQFTRALSEGKAVFRFPDNDYLDDSVRTNDKKGYARTTGKTK